MLNSYILFCEILNHVQLMSRLLQSIIVSITWIKEAVLILCGLVFLRHWFLEVDMVLNFSSIFFSHNSLLSLIKIFNTKVDILYVDPNQICNFSKVLKYCKISFQIHFFQQLPLTSVMKNRVSCEHITRNLSEPGTVHIREWPRSFKAYLPQS